MRANERTDERVAQYLHGFFIILAHSGSMKERTPRGGNRDDREGDIDGDCLMMAMTNSNERIEF